MIYRLYLGLVWGYFVPSFLFLFFFLSGKFAGKGLLLYMGDISARFASSSFYSSSDHIGVI